MQKLAPRFLFNFRYFLWFLLLLFIEIGIATFVHDHFFRPLFGDVLVVILIYLFLRSFLNISLIQAILSVFVFSSIIEFSQLFHLIEILNLQDIEVAHWVLGSSFNPWDFLAYFIGLLVVFLIEKYFHIKSIR